ncbi:putative leucine-rich repeat receptor-like protein kinase At2g19210 [Malania oleifera]|uniref:putative leucine-rich repeat receptor-like protein kinase At2g19210 n=1 Tax=Malania oleifera TaxID=397392 RepID=UPI0025AE4C7D|nr:putative leucine-rich repeat receptor-like protein kinase At2g19210 [Malania oleifera]
MDQMSSTHHGFFSATKILSWLCILSSTLALLSHAQDQSGFLSIDCGLSETPSYFDNQTGLYYTWDSPHIDAGVSSTISPDLISDEVARQFWTLRSFPQGTRNCYTLRPAGGKGYKYLIRASFMYGNYDGRNQPPAFDLHLGPNKWDSVTFNNSSSSDKRYWEMVHVMPEDYVQVCVVNTGGGTPFVSALEMRLLNSSMYTTQEPGRSLLRLHRLDCGSTTDDLVRYNDDLYDRIWFPYPASQSPKWKTLETNLPFNSIHYGRYHPPSTVMTTALTPAAANDSLIFEWTPPDPSSKIFFYMYFAELQQLQKGQHREFDIKINGEMWFESLVPKYLRGITIFSRAPETAAQFNFSITKTTNSTLPPIMNAWEIYVEKELLQSQTDKNDVDAITKIKSIYGIKENWQGDPCAPKAYSWNGLNCSYHSFGPPSIISLNLSSSGLTGNITSYILNLTRIQSLDLSNNNLTGPVPDFLSLLPLSVINLAGNKLTGSVPVELIQRSKRGSLSLSVDENFNPVSQVPFKKMKKKKNVVVPIVASVAALLILMAALVALWCLRWRRQDKKKVNLTLESKKQQFRYSEVLSITNNLTMILGKGGFGTVYLGYINNTEVAVKILSPSSVQGCKQFQSEVKLLMRVHHRNLTSLVGYCDEGTNMALIYEYMANKDLRGLLSGKRNYVLGWEERLRIAIDAAQGLEYLHNGCKPPMIHRDVKSTNILLNGNFQAKLADFGLSRDFPVEGGYLVPSEIFGTLGYIDPEYFSSKRLTMKSDVYSFGIVLLELITGHPALIKGHRNTDIVQWANSVIGEGDIGIIVDPSVQGKFNANSAWKAVEIAMSCVSPLSIHRPNISHVVTELKESLEVEMAPVQNLRNEQMIRSTNSLRMNVVELENESSPQASFIWKSNSNKVPQFLFGLVLASSEAISGYMFKLA